MARNRPIRVLLVDDEPVARRSLRALLRDAAGVEVVGECGSGAEAVRRIAADPPDLLFLDVEMPEVDGFEVLRRVDPETIPAIVFVTAYEQHALRAFDARALDYLLKPVSDERFEVALERARLQIEQRDRRESSAAGPFRTRFRIKSSGRVFFVDVEDVDWIEATSYCVTLHVGKRAHVIRQTMHELEAELDPERFVRIHRSAIVNLGRVREVRTRGGGYVVVLEDGVSLGLSRRRRVQLERLLQPAR